MSQPRSNSNSDAGSVVQPAMFVYRVDDVGKRLALSDGTPRWQYPCGLCNGRLVTQPGALCSVCAPAAPRSRRKTGKARSRKIAAKKSEPATEPVSSGRPGSKRTPPWERVASGSTGDQRGGDGVEITCSFCGHRDSPAGMVEHWCEGRRRFVDGGEPL